MTTTAPTAFNRLLAPLVSPPIFDFWAAKLSPTLSWQRVLARVVARRTEAEGAVTLELQANRQFSGFAPGQHVNVTAEVNGRSVTRSYSFTGIEAAKGRISLTIKQVTGGKLSTQLCQHTEMGDVLELSAAFGDMALPAVPQPLLLLAAGSGITPMMSFVRALAARGMPSSCTLIYWAKTREEICFAAELKTLAAEHSNFTLHLALTRQQAAGAYEIAGRASAELLNALAPELQATATYACGPSDFVQSLAGLVGERAYSFAAEAFTPAARPMAATGTVRVTLAASQRVLELPAGQPLLTALEAQGITPPSGCRMGICNTCACGKLSGTSQNLNTGSTSFEPESALRICISAATSDLVLDL